ncbi:MAG: 1,4-alpha-glucan branching protein GlgB [Gammaproteobacteria bacterium]|nr:1,4-alpha-glucan branching protein GlgB [Gammaproteobacteria bacterium]
MQEAGEIKLPEHIRRSRFSEYDIYLLREGSHTRLYEKFGAHLVTHDGVDGASFAVWAPNAAQVAVIGDFNQWNPAAQPLRPRGDESGIWEGFVPGVKAGASYKYHVISRYHDFRIDKADPFACCFEQPGGTASVVWPLDYKWSDDDWMRERRHANALSAPMAIYELHIGSWRRVPEEGNRSLSYRELAEQLPDYLAQMGYTHVEFLPVTEHPFYGSWGYQATGYFAPTSRYGTPQDFMHLVDRLHQRGIGVILDWVPSHFPSDGHGLAYFDGTHLYEHADPRQGFHPEWKSYIFNYGRAEVRAFLTSSAVFWLNKYHIDGLRVDAVASMLYLDYSRKAGEWIPNARGGKENLEAIVFLRHLNETAYREQPDIQMIAEESTAWPMVTRPTSIGGLGFGLKWNMGWMHDTLDFAACDPLYRKYHHNQLTFGIWYAFSENFVLPLSHDEVVHGKGSLIGKMPGDDWQKFANLRLLFGYMYTHPGKKLMFMGDEFAQWREWNHDNSLDWHLLNDSRHGGLQQWVRDLNWLYRDQPALHALDHDHAGFEWVDFHDAEQSVVSFLRRGGDDELLVICNFTPMPRHNYRIGVPSNGYWCERLNSDAPQYGGASFGNLGGVEAAPIPAHGHRYSLSLTLPPLGVLVLAPS